MAKRGRKPVRITKSEYINEYWEKHKEKLSELYPPIGVHSSEKIFKDIAKNNLANMSWNSKKNAKRDMEDLLYERKYGWEKANLRKAKRDALDNPFDDMRKLNNKFGEYIPADIDLGKVIDETGAEVDEAIVGYWGIADEDVVLAEISRSVGGSPVSYYRFVDAGLIS